MRCFIAVEIPDETKKKISHVKKEFQGKIVSDENIHVTLKFLGDVDEKNIPNIIEKLKKVSFKSFDISFIGVGAFPKNSHARVLWIGCESPELNALARQIQHILPPSEDFVGHVTVARMEYQDVTSFVNKHKDNEFGTMHCTSFVLKKSILTPKGSVYSTIETFYAQ